MITVYPWNQPNRFLILAQEPGAVPGLLQMLMPIMLIAMLFYFLMVLPEKRKRADVSRMQQNLKKNDRIVTIGGILGIVVNTQAGSGKITIRVDETNNTRLEILRSSVARVLNDEKSETADAL